MHTIRNRRAANPPLAKASRHLLPGLEARKRKQRKFVISTGQIVPGLPPSFPASIAIPPHRGAVASAVALDKPQITSMAAPAATAKAAPQKARKASAAKPKPRKPLRKGRAKTKAKLRQPVILTLPALPLPVLAEALVITPPASPAREAPVLRAPATPPQPQSQALPMQIARSNLSTAPIARSHALAAHRPDGLLNHIAAWLASRGQAIRSALIGKSRRAPQLKPRLQPMAVQKPRRDPRQDELARLRHENHKLQLQVQAFLDLQAASSRPKEPV